jgi:hypothetical protein
VGSAISQTLVLITSHATRLEISTGVLFFLVSLSFCFEVTTKEAKPKYFKFKTFQKWQTIPHSPA